MKKNSILKRTIGFVVVGIIIALVFTLSSTYSWFQNSGECQGEVVAASSEDIIANIEIYYQGDMPILSLEKGTGVDYSPIIFFSVEGDAEEYLLHIDPVKLDGIVEIPIIPNVNLYQAISLIVGSEEEIVGNIRIKHLNNFIDESMEVSLSKEYLLSRFYYNRGLRNYGNNYLSYKEKNELIDLVENSLLYVGEYLDWEAIEWEEDGNWVSEAYISSDQALLIDIIAPNLLVYNEKLYEAFEIITNELNNEIEKNNLLVKEKEELLTKIEELEKENNELYKDIYFLETEIEELLILLEPEDSDESEEPEEPKEPENPEELDESEELQELEKSEEEIEQTESEENEPIIEQEVLVE